MTTRTFTQLIQGYGADPVTITASVDGTQIFSGPVNTVDQPLPTLPDENDYGVSTFNFTRDITFEGNITLTITHAGEHGIALVTDTLADWSKVFGTDPKTGKFYVTTSGADNFVTYYFETLSDAEGNYVTSEPFKSVMINGVDVTEPVTRSYPGQRYHFLQPGDVLTATVTITAGYANVYVPATDSESNPV